MHLLVGLLTGSNASCRLQAVRCLHELSHSSHANVAPACLPATPYLLTYLSGQSTKFTVSICLYQFILYHHQNITAVDYSVVSFLN